MNDLSTKYSMRLEQALVPLASRLQNHLFGCLEGVPRIDRISARAKTLHSFLKKAAKTDEGNNLKYPDPLNQIQDQLGARITALYVQDVDAICDRVPNYLHAIEQRIVVPDSQSKFGYFGRHFILLLPSDIKGEGISEDQHPSYFELQVKTVFQHAWAEAEHDLAYKATAPLSPEQERKVAFTSAQAWGADEMFRQLAAEIPSVLTSA